MARNIKDYIEYPPYLPDCYSGPDCLTNAGDDITEEEFFDIVNANNRFLLATYHDQWDGGIDASFDTTEFPPSGPGPEFSDLYEKWIANNPNEQPRYDSNGQRWDSARILVETPVILEGTTGACGTYSTGFHKYLQLNDYGTGYFWRASSSAQATRYIYGDCPGYVIPPGYELVDGIVVLCNSTLFEILNNVNFASLTNETTADSWESQDILYNQISQSDFVPVDLNNIAHFGDHTCEYIKQPLTILNGEYRYNNTITLKIEFSYIDVRTATPDSKIVINLGGELEIFDIGRIKEELTGPSGLYSYATGGEVAYVEFPAPSVNPGEFAIAEMWQIGNIVAEVTKFGVLGADPCVKTELYDIEATEEIIECTPPPPCIPQYLYNQDLYRRQIVTFKTDIQGLIPQYLDKIMISHSALQWGEAGQIAVRDLDNLTLSENLVDLTDGKTIVFRDINGDISGAYGVGIIDEYTIQVPGMPDWVQVNTFYTIQEMATAKEFLVISVRPSGDDVTIECVNYDENIYKDGGC